MQGNSRYSGGSGPFNLRRGAIHHFDIEVRRTELHRVALCFDQDVGKNWNGIAPFHHGLRLRDSFQKRATFHAEFHAFVLRAAGR